MSETMIPAACSRCGMPILWVRRAENGGSGFYPPLDGATAVKRYALTPDARLHFVDTYVIHNCTPGVADPEIAEAARAVHPLAEQTGKTTAPEPALTSGQIRDRTLEVDCPLCKALAGELCLNLYRQARGEKVDQYWQHNSRKVAACPDQYGEDQAKTLLDRDQRLLADEQARAAKSLAQREQRLAQNEAIVATTRCPECRASRGVQCWDLNALARGTKKHNNAPHRERRDTYLARKRRERDQRPD